MSEDLIGALPFAEYSNPMTAMYQIALGKSPPIAEDIPASSSLREFVSLCCAVEPNDRPSAEELLQHPFILRSPDNRNMMCRKVIDEERISPKGEQDQNISLPSNQALEMARIEANTEEEEKPNAALRVSEGQMMLQKLNRVVVIDIHANSEPTIHDETIMTQNQVTPVVHQRKRRSTSNVSHIQSANTRSSPLLPPTGKKSERKNSTKPVSDSDSHVTSPSSVIKATPSVEDHERTSSRSRTNSSACPTPVMFSSQVKDPRSSLTPPFVDMLDDEKKTSSIGLHSEVFGYQFPITVSHENELLLPPALSRSASLNDAMVSPRHVSTSCFLL